MFMNISSVEVSESYFCLCNGIEINGIKSGKKGQTEVSACVLEQNTHLVNHWCICVPIRPKWLFNEYTYVYNGKFGIAIIINFVLK